MELNPKLSPRNSIVIKPYRSAVENKVQAFDEAQGVFKEVTAKKLTAYLKQPQRIRAQENYHYSPKDFGNKV